MPKFGPPQYPPGEYPDSCARERDYYEIARGNESAGNLGFSVSAVRGGTRLTVYAPSFDRMSYAIEDLIGSVELQTPDATGHVPNIWITRKLPRRHPWAPNLFCTGINNIQGIGRQAPAEGLPDDWGCPVLDELYPHYDNWEFVIDWGRPDYNILPDDALSNVLQKSYYNYKNELVPFTYTNEWTRYVTWQEKTEMNILTSKFGMMYFQTQDNTLPGAADVLTAVHFQAYPYQTLPDSVVVLRWHMVPLRFITSKYSFLRNCPAGVINQFDFFEPSPGAPPMFPKGTLRYAGYTYTYFRPPVENEVAGSQDMNRLCNIDITFNRTTRDRFVARKADGTPNVPTLQTASNPTGALMNANWLACGWNLQPWLMRPNSYYYAHAVDMTTGTGTDVNDKTRWAPPHTSFPFELFFADPDAPQPGGGAKQIEVNPDYPNAH